MIKIFKICFLRFPRRLTTKTKKIKKHEKYRKPISVKIINRKHIHTILKIAFSCIQSLRNKHRLLNFVAWKLGGSISFFHNRSWVQFLTLNSHNFNRVWLTSPFFTLKKKSRILLENTIVAENSREIND